jgi:hypothetical protein
MNVFQTKTTKIILAAILGVVAVSSGRAPAVFIPSVAPSASRMTAAR